MQTSDIRHGGYPTIDPYGDGVSLGIDPYVYEAPSLPFAEGGSVISEIGPLLLVGVLCVPVMVVMRMVDLTWVGLTVVGTLFILGAAVRIELGLLALAIMIPWEVQTRLSEGFTVVKAMGFPVAALGMLHLLRGRSHRSPALVKAISVFCLWAVLGVVCQPTIPSFFLLLALLSNVAFVYLLQRFCPAPAALRALVFVTFLSAVGQALLGLVMFLFTGTPLGKWGVRLTTSADININTYVRLLFFGVFLGPVVLAYVKSLPLKIMAVLGIAVSIVAALLTGSRGAVMGLGLGGLVILLALKSDRFRGGGKLLAIGATIFLVLVSLMVVSRSGGMEVWTKRLSSAALASGAQVRLRNWAESMKLAVRNPVLGVGFGNEALSLWNQGYYATESHNDLVTVTATTGIPGLLMYLSFLALWLVELWRMPRGIWRAALLGMWVAFFITAMFNPSLSAKSLWLAVGISAASIVCARNYQESSFANLEQAAPVP